MDEAERRVAQCSGREATEPIFWNFDTMTLFARWTGPAL
jgi:hypothetical protein